MASFWNRLFRRSEKMDTLELFREIYGGTQTWAGNDVTLKTALQVSTALACGRVISEGIAMLPWKVMQHLDRSIQPALTHWLYDRLATAPNILQTAFEFKETMGLHLVFCGNAFIWLPTVSGWPELYLLDPKWVTVKYKWPDLPTYEIRIDDGRTMKLSAADIWHVKGPAWCDYTGLELYKLARQALGLAMAIEEGQAKIQAQGVKASGHFSVDGTLTEEQQKKLKKWIEEVSGSKNAGIPFILDRAAKFVSMSMSNVDAQMVEMRKFQIEEVCRFFRVMPIMVGFSDKAATYASAEQMFIAHSVHTLGPWMTRLEQSVDKRLLTPEERQAGYYTKFNEKALLRTTARDQMDLLARGVLSGIILRNEAREKLDMNPVDGGDQMLTPVNTFIGNPEDMPKPTSGPAPTPE